MSIQGVQPKLSAKIDLKESGFVIVDTGGKFIIKPQNRPYKELPENEDVTMRLANIAKIETPVHGLLYCADGSLSYFVKRFDRFGKNQKLPMEDFAQIAGLSRDTKYNYSVEKLIGILENCTFIEVEKAELFKRTLFNYLIGNNDMHLKNFSLITIDDRIMLAPAYDYLNTTLAYQTLGRRAEDCEEFALTLKGKRRNLTKNNLVSYLGIERLKLNLKVIESILEDLQNVIPRWEKLIEISFLSDEHKELYIELINKRRRVLDL